MLEYTYPHYPTSHGYLTDSIRQKYINHAIIRQVLPRHANDIEDIMSLSAPNDEQMPIQFWQLVSVLGLRRIIVIVKNFYDRVYADEHWFKSVFEKVASKQRHIKAQSAMWIDAMGGGPYYHGGEYRLSFHHAHNAVELMNNKGAQHWSDLMLQTLNDSSIDMTDDPRVRPSINTFLTYFFEKYAAEYGFHSKAAFGVTNPPIRSDDAQLDLSQLQLENSIEMSRRDK